MARGSCGPDPVPFAEGGDAGVARESEEQGRQPATTRRRRARTQLQPPGISVSGRDADDDDAGQNGKDNRDDDAVQRRRLLDSAVVDGGQCGHGGNGHGVRVRGPDVHADGQCHCGAGRDLAHHETPAARWPQKSPSRSRP